MPDSQLQSKKILSEQIFKQNSLHCYASLKNSFHSVCSGVKWVAPNQYTLQFFPAFFFFHNRKTRTSQEERLYDDEPSSLIHAPLPEFGLWQENTVTGMDQIKGVCVHPCAKWLHMSEWHSSPSCWSIYALNWLMYHSTSFLCAFPCCKIFEYLAGLESINVSPVQYPVVIWCQHSYPYTL